MGFTESWLLKASAADLQKLLKSGELSSVALVNKVLAQAAKYDRKGPTLRALISESPAAIRVAEQLDAERAEGKLRGPLHGIPIIVKDVFNSGPDLSMFTTLGSYAFKEATARKNAVVLDQLIEAGLIILGKASLTELGNWKGDNLTSGWSALSGQTQSAYVEGGVKHREMRLGHSAPGGSSSGSAVGVSAGYSPLSLGTELDGSTVTPASRSALYAIKPSNDAVSMEGVFVVSEYFDVVGSMAKTVEDVATLLAYTLDKEPRSKLPEDGYQSALVKEWTGISVGFVDPDHWRLPGTLVKPDEDVLRQTKESLEQVVSKIRELGGKATYPVELRHPSTFASDMRTVIVHESTKVIPEYLQLLDNAPKTVDELVKFNEEHADLELPEDYPNQALLHSTITDNATDEESDNAKAELRSIAYDAISKVLVQYSIDAIIAPMDSPIATVAACAGGPIGTVPLGLLKKFGRPFGLGIVARPGEETTVLKVMSAYEATFPERELPTLLNKDSDTLGQSAL